jgi:hypothetical protein
MCKSKTVFMIKLSVFYQPKKFAHIHRGRRQKNIFVDEKKRDGRPDERVRLLNEKKDGLIPALRNPSQR